MRAGVFSRPMDDEDPGQRIAELEAQLALLEAERDLTQAADEVLEVALRDRLALERTLRMMLPVLVEHVEALGAVVRTFDEDLELRDFGSPGLEDQMPVAMGDIAMVTDRREPYARIGDGRTILGQHLDVAGELFGACVVCFDAEMDETSQQEARSLIDTWCEMLDNYLAAIAESRRKHRVIQSLSDALREPVLDVGIDRAIAVLQDNIDFENLLLVFRHVDDITGATLHYKIIQDGELTHDSSIPRDMEIDEFIRTSANQMIRGTARELVEHFGMGKGREEVLISGPRDERALGRIVVTSALGEFNTSDRDLVERFADHLRQRVIDYNREWKHLSLCFPDGIVHRLLAEEGYVDKRLRPVEQDVAVLFTDIAGFTRLSEQALKEPRLIGQLVNTWSERVVDIIWEAGGVVDKMVGDCVIAMWGPPFSDLTARTACRRAAEAAREIRDYTRSLNGGVEIPALKGLSEPIGVATGLNEDYTGFSSGMNNTARLQGVARRDEILCLDPFVAAFEDPTAFGDERTAEVKNVAEPLRFRPLR
jgi:adenylate cyclase